MKAFLDGNCVCIVKDDFINLQESPALFLPLNILSEVDLIFISDYICGIKQCDNWKLRWDGKYRGCGKCIWCVAHQHEYDTYWNDSTDRRY